MPEVQALRVLALAPAQGAGGLVSEHDGRRSYRSLLLAAGSLDVCASFLSFVVFRSDLEYFILATVVTMTLVAFALLLRRWAALVLTGLALVGAATQVPFDPLGSSFLVFMLELGAAALAIAYLRMSSSSKAFN